MIEREFKATLETRNKKDGSGTYQAVVIKLTNDYEKLVFLKPAEIELLKITTEKKDNKKMPF